MSNTTKVSKKSKKVKQSQDVSMNAESVVLEAPQQKFVCCVCDGDKTTLRMNKKPRWHSVDEIDTLCHGCWLKSRSDE